MMLNSRLGIPLAPVVASQLSSLTRLTTRLTLVLLRVFRFNFMFQLWIYVTQDMIRGTRPSLFQEKRCAPHFT